MTTSKLIHTGEYKYLNYTHDTNDNIIPKTKNACRIMTYNVHGFRDIQCKNKYTEIVKTILSIDPDILVLEEVKLYNYANICTELQLRNHLDKIGLYFSAFSSCGLNAVFSKTSFSAFEIDLGRDPIRHIARNALICTFDKNLTVIGTHLDVFDETGKLRIKQITSILETLKNMDNIYHNRSISKIIVAGDFNSLRKSDYTSKEWHHICELDKKRKITTVQDAIPIIEEKGFIDSFSHLGKSVKISVWSGKRVDYIFGKNIDFVQTASYKVTHSDHYPIYADFFII
jgi:endonuclease/exonuclease/phosphatase family metal-dependent hydrolase